MQEPWTKEVRDSMLAQAIFNRLSSHVAESPRQQVFEISDDEIGEARTHAADYSKCLQDVDVDLDTDSPDLRTRFQRESALAISQGYAGEDNGSYKEDGRQREIDSNSPVATDGKVSEKFVVEQLRMVEPAKCRRPMPSAKHPLERVMGRGQGSSQHVGGGVLVHSVGARLYERPVGSRIRPWQGPTIREISITPVLRVASDINRDWQGGGGFVELVIVGP